MRPASKQQIERLTERYGQNWTYQAPPYAQHFDKIGLLELRANGAGVFDIPNNRTLVRVKGVAGMVYVLQRYGCTFTDYRPDPDLGNRAKPVLLPPLGLYPHSWSVKLQPRTDGIGSMRLVDNNEFTGYSDFVEKDIHKGANPLIVLCPNDDFLEIVLHNNGAMLFQAEADQYGVIAAHLGGFFLDVPKSVLNAAK